MWCPVLAAIHWSRYGAPGEQQHLPDWSSPRQQRTAPRRLYSYDEGNDACAETNIQNETVAAGAGAAGGRPATSRAWPRSLRVPDSAEAPVRDLNHDFKELCRHNRDGSYATQADRAHILDLIANQLHEMGVRGLRAQGFKPRHVQMLVARWLGREARPGDHQEPDERAALASAEDRQGQHRRAHQCRLRHPGSGVRHQHLQGKGAWQGTTRAHPHPRCPDVAALAGRLRPAPGGLDQDRSGLGRPGRHAGAQGFLEQGRTGDPDSHPHPGAAATPRRGQGARQGQESGRTGLRHLPRLPAALSLRVRAGRHPRLPRASAFVCPGALPGNDGLGSARRAVVRGPSSSRGNRRPSTARRGRPSATRWATAASRSPRCTWVGSAFITTHADGFAP